MKILNKKFNFLIGIKQFRCKLIGWNFLKILKSIIFIKAYKQVTLLEQLSVKDEEIDEMEPLKNGLTTFFSFLIFGVISMIPIYFSLVSENLNRNLIFALSSLFAAISLFTLGKKIYKGAAKS